MDFNFSIKMKNMNKKIHPDMEVGELVKGVISIANIETDIDKAIALSDACKDLIDRFFSVEISEVDSSMTV
jgi:hypothetical protein